MFLMKYENIKINWTYLYQWNILILFKMIPSFIITLTWDSAIDVFE